MSSDDAPRARSAWAAGARHPETPRWLAARRELVFIDGLGGELLRFDPARGTGTRHRLADELGFVEAAPDGGLHYGTGLAVHAWGSAAALAVVPGDAARLRLNDAGRDDRGRLWTGSMDRRGEQPLGALWRIEPDGRVQPIDSGYTIPNGFAFARDGATLYVADSPRRVVHAYALDAARDVRSRSVLIGPGAFGDAYPDGMAVDAEDHLWIACYDGGCLRRFRPDGTLERSVPVPAAKVTACTFGGDSLATLYVTAGDGLYAFDPGVPGPDGRHGT
ncbi:MAG: SMP-30/gluconolactonase/LRE family protein [Steroidobacteraceae bacterium]|jgi:sugar lactone lactonase YvrE|nr:SMP-30/gluconolactonase/LRE family protein [Steroidobacteraceae bacterium]